MHGNSSSKLSAEAVLQLQRSLQQLQQELAAAVQERDAAQEQLYQAVRRADAAAAALQDAEKWKQAQQEAERKVRSLLLFGLLPWFNAQTCVQSSWLRCLCR
jgi:type I site-specific restriction endonuclease